MDYLKLRVGFIGAGANTRQMHIPGFQKIENVELAVVANRSLASAAEVARKDGIKRAVATWQEVIEDPSVDAICVGTWPNMHAELTIAALGVVSMYCVRHAWLVIWQRLNACSKLLRRILSWARSLCLHVFVGF